MTNFRGPAREISTNLNKVQEGEREFHGERHVTEESQQASNLQVPLVL